MKLGSLFSGAGGLDLACEAFFGARTAWVSDIDPGACKVLVHRFPHAPNLGDITRIDWAGVQPVDIIAGGSPCQDLSTAGRRSGMTDGTRSNLWVQMREAIAHVRPRYVVWENVRGAYSARAASALESDPRLLGDHPAGQPALRALGRVLGDLADLGYDASWCGLRAADVGAPHGRFRVFVVATDTRRGGGHEAVEHDGRGAAFGDGSGVPDQRHREPLWAGPERDGLTLLPTPRATDGTEGGPNQRGSSGDLMLPSAVVQLLLTPSVADVTGGRKARSGTRSDELLLNGIAHTQNWGQYAAAIARWERLTRPAPPPTEPGPKGNPRLSARFTEWMLGWPDGWVTDVPGVTRNEALKICGNGVVPQQALAALAHLTLTERAA